MDTVLGYAVPVLLIGLVVAVCLAVLCGIAWVGCEVFARKWDETGLVVGKSNTPDTRQTSSVPVVTGNGQVGVGIVSTGHDREWITLIEVGGEVYEFDNLTVYVKAEVGDRLPIQLKRNAMSGISVEGVTIDERRRR